VTALVADSAIADHTATDRPPARLAVRRQRREPGQGGPRVVVGEVGDQLDVTGRVVVHGSVTAGATLTDGASLQVQGCLDGLLRLGVDAEVVVHGTYRGDAVVNRGLVRVSGIATLDAARRPRVAVAYGTLLRGAYGEAWTVDGNGQLRRLDGATSIDLRMATHLAASFCVWSELAGCFVPLEELAPIG
jgi:hypothetical protein